MQLINNLSSRLKKHEAAIKVAINRVIENGWLVLGPEVNKFEQAFANYLEAAYCISLANGTDAIELALKAANVKAGDKVATVANAGMYTTTALLAIQAEPYFMDVDLNTANVTLAEVVSAVEAGTRAVVVTHLYGLAIAEIAQISDYCKQREVVLIEDCAQAHGAKIDGKYAGTFGDAASFSFYPTKNLGALGDGGAVVTNQLKIAERIKLLRQYGWVEKYKTEVTGARNSRLDEIQAAILSELLPHLDETNLARREIAKRYSNEIKHPQITLPAIGQENYVAHLFVLRSPLRNLLREHLLQLKIVTDIHYPIPDYRQPALKTFNDLIPLQNTEHLANEILTLPCYPEMTSDEVDYVIKSVNSW